jgi:hypothetical protein
LPQKFVRSGWSEEVLLGFMPSRDEAGIQKVCVPVESFAVDCGAQFFIKFFVAKYFAVGITRSLPPAISIHH